MHDALVINEIYLSLQGESTFAGLPCIFVRLTGCNLRCSYCDTAYAFAEGRPWTLGDILTEIARLAAPLKKEPFRQRLPLVELTGGEPLLQPNAVPLMKSLCDAGYTVLVETSGALDIGPVDSRVHRIMDLKCPASGEAHRNRWENLALLTRNDEIKFVVSTREDYDWACQAVVEHSLSEICPLLFSWAAPLQPHQRHTSLRAAPTDHTPLSQRELAERIIADALPVRFQAQLHKIIWPPDRRGV